VIQNGMPTRRDHFPLVPPRKFSMASLIATVPRPPMRCDSIQRAMMVDPGESPRNAELGGRRTWWAHMWVGGPPTRPPRVTLLPSQNQHVEQLITPSKPASGVWKPPRRITADPDRRAITPRKLGHWLAATSRRLGGGARASERREFKKGRKKKAAGGYLVVDSRPGGAWPRETAGGRGPSSSR
jgi:hypothetical protein